MTQTSAFECGRSSPRRGGAFPRSVRCACLAACMAPLAPAACSNGSADQVTAPLPLGMSSAMEPYYNDGNLALYQAARPAPLPVLKPTSTELKALGPAPSGTPYPRAPFLTAGDESVEVHYTISNLDDSPHTVWLLIDPWNEFVRYVPGVTVVDDDTTIPNYGYDQSFWVPGLSRVEGTLTSDDMQEIARKLAAVENVASQAAAITAAAEGADMGPTVSELINHIFNPQNRSNADDPLYTPYIPPVVAGVTGFDLGIRTFEPANVAVEITMDIEDLTGNRFYTLGTANVDPMGVPTTILSPPAARF